MCFLSRDDKDEAKDCGCRVDRCRHAKEAGVKIQDSMQEVEQTAAKLEAVEAAEAARGRAVENEAVKKVEKNWGILGIF